MHHRSDRREQQHLQRLRRSRQQQQQAEGRSRLGDLQRLSRQVEDLPLNHQVDLRLGRQLGDV
jgi:hypothetical protein